MAQNLDFSLEGPVTLADGSTVTPDLSIGNWLQWTLPNSASQRTFANPLTFAGGQGKFVLLQLVGPASGSYTGTLTFGSLWNLQSSVQIPNANANQFYTFLWDGNLFQEWGRDPGTGSGGSVNFGSPVKIGTSNTDGSSVNAARADHQHDGLGEPQGLTGAVAATRYVGATASGAPGSGTFAVGDFSIDQTGKMFICTGAGTPGTWVSVTPSFGSPVTLGTALSDGVATTAARSDHVHSGLGLPQGLTGATQATRYVGATASGAPVSGTFAIGDYAVARDGHLFVCTAAGTPGTWADVGAGVTFGSPVKIGTANANGGNTTAARSDHVHDGLGEPQGLTGAVSATRYVGATISAAPASGTFALGDFCVTQDGHIFVCTVAGTPGTWVDVGSGVSFGTPVTIGTANAAGSNATAARSDHVHAGLGLSQALTGATAATKYVGATTGGAPASGTFAVGDFAIDQTGFIFVCTVAGTPGTWSNVGTAVSFGTPVGIGTANAAGASSSATRADHVHSGLGLSQGLTGAVAATRYAGAVASGHPTSGSFLVGDFTVDQAGAMWVCTVAGTPGTWVGVGVGGITDPLNTKGDIWVFGTADARLGVGADGQLLQADSTQTVGLKWISFATPSLTLGTLNASGSTNQPIRADATIAAFDGTVPTTSAVGDAAATGSQARAARRDHVHGREAFGSPVLPTSALAAGAATTETRSDHTHADFTVVRTADSSGLNTQTTPQNDDTLKFTMGSSATEMWSVELFLLVNAVNATMDFKAGWSVPGSCTMQWAAEGTINSVASNIGSFSVNNVGLTPPVMVSEGGTIAGATANGTVGMSFVGIVYGGGTGGTVNFQWAQNTSDAGNLILKKGSFLRVTKLAA